MLRYAEICVDDDNNDNDDRTDHFAPCAIARGNKEGSEGMIKPLTVQRGQ